MTSYQEQMTALALKEIVGKREKETGAIWFASEALQALECRLGLSDAKERSPYIRQLARAPLSAIAAKCLEIDGKPVSGWEPPEQIFSEAFAIGGEGRIGMANPAANRPGSFPNILSALANKVLDHALETATPTYEH